MNNRESRIIIYGAGAYGRLAYKLFKHIGKTPFGFCDRKEIKKSGMTVLPPDELEKYRDYYIYIATRNYYEQIYNELRDRGFEFLYDIKFLLDMDIDIDQIELSDDEEDAWAQRDKYIEAVNQCRTCETYFVHLEVVITERCSLRCRNCSSLMPYYDCPDNLDIDKVIEDIKKVVLAVDSIGEVRILGGEPFLNAQIDELIEYLAHENKIRSITVYTNGTVIPSEGVLQAIERNNVFVHISDYGIKNERRRQLIDILESNNIQFSCRKYSSWFDFGKVEKNSFNDLELQKIFTNCSSAQCFTLHRGKIFHCPRSAHAHMLGVVQLPDEEYVDVGEENLKKRVNELLHRKNYIATCAFCKGTNGETIKPAIQVDTK